MAEMEMPSDTLINGRYRLLSRIGGGSFGEVWLARDEKVGMEVAIKLYVALDDRGVEDFKSEYKAVFDLNHRNLLHASYYDVYGSRPYLVMPYCPSGSAETLVEKTDESSAWRFIRDVSAGLAYLHEQEPPMVHQDIKPANILIDPSGHFVITDFGISRRIRNSMTKNSTQMTSSGTVAYMGPERFSAKPSPVKASDIWSMGAALYELLTGELPFCGMGGGMMLSGAVVPKIEGNYSKDLKETIKACLAKDTWARPTASELSEYAASKLKGENLPKPWKDRLRHKKPWYKKLWLWTVLLLIIISIGYCVSPDPDAPLSVQPEPVMDTSATTVPADTVDVEKLQDSLRRAEAYQDSLRRAEAYFDSLREVRVQDSLDAVREEQAKVAEIEAAERKKAEERTRKEKQAEEKARRDAARQDSIRRAEAYQDSLEAARATTGVHNGHEWVDLGLSVLWATCNVGASSPSDYGGYYAWGETKTKSNYTEDNSRTYEVSMDDISGNPSYDAATANWGDGWRMPTNEELEELMYKCDCQGTPIGYKVTGPNGNSIFLPAAGWRNGTSLDYAGMYGYYWSSSPFGSATYGAFTLYLRSDGCGVSCYSRNNGYSVRPVIDIENTTYRPKSVTQPTKGDVLHRNKKDVYRVGDYYNVDGKEGIVFSIDSTGKHGKIISMKTVVRQWSIVNTVTGANDMNDGRKNMSVIQEIPNWEELFPAFDYCYNALGHDWYLPAYNELKQIFFNKEILINALESNGGDARLKDTHYSSSELSRDKAWMIMTQFDELHEEVEEVFGYEIDLRGCDKTDTDGWIRAVTTF